MAGRMGGVRTTTQNLTVHAVDAEQGLLLIKGAVPGPTGGVVLVRTAVKNGLGKGGAARDCHDRHRLTTVHARRQTADGHRSSCPATSSTSRSTSR